MDQRENLHAGHRERMLEKFLNQPEAFSEHELLEMLLFPLIPRKNTNDVAHRLLMCFGNLERIFSVTAKELMIVEGIGKKVATQIHVIGRIYLNIYQKYKHQEDVKWTAFGKDKHRYIEFFDGMRQEALVMIFIDKRGREITRSVFCDNSKNQVALSIPEISRSILANKPYAVIIAHNHPSGVAEPSLEDDKATAKIFTTCEIAGTKLIDHVIVAQSQVYSYKHNEERIEAIKEKFNISAFFDDIDGYKEINYGKN
jgi:DNA repair protein RadC